MLLFIATSGDDTDAANSLRCRMRLFRKTAGMVSLFRFMVFCFLLFGIFRLEMVSAQDGFSGYQFGNPLFQSTTSRNKVNWTETFESPGVSWRYLYRESAKPSSAGDTTAGVEILEHLRTNDSACSGRQSEKVTVRFDRPGFLLLAHYLDYPVFMNETVPSLWLRADRPEIAFGALVVLPKTLRPDTQTPLTFLVPGDVYSNVGSWQKLGFSNNFRRTFQNIVQALRSEQRFNIDTSAAYIRQLVLLVEGRRGTCSLLTDDIQVVEHLPSSLTVLETSENNAVFNPVNLLAFRIAVSKISLFPDTEYGTSDDLGREPFGIDLYANEDSENNGKSEYLKAIERLYADVYRSTGIDPVTDNTKSSAPLKESLAVKPAGSYATRANRIGQVDYQQQNIDGSTGNVLSTAWLHKEPAAGNKGTIISGSGTLPDAKDASLLTATRTAAKRAENVQFRNRFLSVGGSPSYGIRAVQYQNEPLLFLKELGFNAVWVDKAPSAALLKESRDADIWLIAPPPIGAETVNSQVEFGKNGTPVTTEKNILPYFNRLPVSPDYDSVLLWDFEKGHHESHLPQLRAAANLVRKLDSRHRPIICSPESGIAAYTFNSSDFNAILIGRQPFLTSLDLQLYGQWLRRYTQMATPEFPFWNEIQTQPDNRLLAQSRFFGAVEEMPGLISYEQMRQQVRLSLAAGCHGLLFTSEAPLNGTDHETQYRACALELLNLELMLTEPWFAGADSEELVESNEPDFAAVVQQTKRTGLILPISTAPLNQYVMGQAANNNVRLVAPVREGYTADLLVPGSLRKVPAKRRAGGVSLNLEEASMNSVIFLTQSDWHNQKMSESAPQFGQRMSQLAIRLTKMRMDVFEKTLTKIGYLRDMNRIPKPGNHLLLDIPEQDTSLTQTRSAIAQADSLYDAKDYSQAYLQAERAGREIRMLERRFWETATRYEDNRPVLPVSVSFSMIPAYLETYMRIFSREIQLAEGNRILGGDMEDEAAWKSGNWLRLESKINGVKTDVFWDEGSAHSGQHGLRLTSVNQEGKGPAEMERSPIWLEAPVSVQTGEMICIHGWIKIPKAITNTVDGVTIFENHGGPALALRFIDATEWRQFAFYRYAAFDGEMRITIALNGYGEVWLDDVSAHVVRDSKQRSSEQ